MSPYWPSSYLKNRQCIYIIRQPSNEKIYLNFTHLELERHPNCSLNYIEVIIGSYLIKMVKDKLDETKSGIFSPQKGGLWAISLP